MTTTESFELINPIQQGTGTFTRFRELPPDVRQVIWELSLCHERLVQVDLIPGQISTFFEQRDHEAPATTMQETSLRHWLKSKHYAIVLSNKHEISKLFRVCQESRQAAHRFYRVQVPCHYKHHSGQSAPGTFYFHPELDTLHIGGFQRHFASFAHELWSHDPERVGLISIALTSAHRCDRSHGLVFDPTEGSKDLLRPALARLRCVILGQALELRRDFPQIERLANPKPNSRMPRRQAFFERQNRMRRSYPLLAAISRFDRISLDPRGVDWDLRRVYIGRGDPRTQMYSWFKGLSQWNIQYQQPVDYRFMITFSDKESVRANNRDEALLSLQEEKRTWDLYQHARA